MVRALLYQLFVEANAPLPTMGVKRWSNKLTLEQRTVLESLPAARAVPDDVLRVHEEVSLAFVRGARRITSTSGVTWPNGLHERVTSFLQARGLLHLDDLR